MGLGASLGRWADKLILARSLVVAIVVLVFFLAGVTLLLVLWRVGYLKPAWPTRSMPDFEEFLEDYVAEVLERTRQSKLPGAAAVTAAVTADDVLFYYKFNFFFRKYGDKNWLLKKLFLRAEEHAVEADAPESVLRQIGDPDSGVPVERERYLNYKSRVLVVLDRWRTDVAQAASQVAVNAAAPATMEQLNTLLLDMLLNDYGAQLVRLLETRKNYGVSWLDFTLFRLYLTDIANTIFNEKIKALWSSMSERSTKLADQLKKYYWSVENTLITRIFKDSDASAGSGQSINSHYAFAKRRLEDDDAQILNPPQKKQVVEHFGFFLFIPFIPAIALVGAFFTKGFKLVKNIIELTLKLFAAVMNPVKFIQLLLRLVLGAALMVAYYVVGTLLNILAQPIALLLLIVSAVVFSVAWVVVFVAVLLLFVVLWALDKVTGGSVVWALRCENSPLDWYRRGGFHRGNKYKRTVLCGAPCGASFCPSGVFCKRLPPYEPALCPQQRLFSMFKGEDTGADLQLFQLAVPSSFWRQPEEGKKDYIKQFYKSKREFMGACGAALERYQPIARAICDNVDTAFPEQQANSRAKQLCRMMFCGGPGAANPSRRYPFCVETTEAPVQHDKDVVTDVLFYAVAVTALVFVLGIGANRELLGRLLYLHQPRV